MVELQKLLWAAQAPVAILGGGGWSEKACAAFARFAERFDLPVVTSFRRSMLLMGRTPITRANSPSAPIRNCAPASRRPISCLSSAAGMAEVPSQGYELFEIPTPRQILVHVHAGAEELGRVYHAALAIHASPPAFAAALESLQPPDTIAWSAQTRHANAEFRAWSDQARPMPGALQLAEIMLALRARLPAETIITNGAGNYAIWVGRFLRYRRYGTQLAPVSGSMGYGLPAAVGAKRLFPERMVVCFAGDGCFLMNGQEFATAVQYELPIVVVVVDNGMFGTIRMHQERRYPGRVSATSLRNPDFAALARAYGGHGESVTETDAFMPAFERAVESGLPSILHVIIDPQAITPTTTIDAIRGS